MIFYLHFILLTSGLSGISVLLGVYVEQYTKASQFEIGLLIMSLPFVQIIVRPLICSMADRRMAHRSYLVASLVMLLLGYAPLLVIPFFEQFYLNHARLSFYLIFLACHLGSGSLVVAWSLGEALAINICQKRGTEYTRMRLTGTVSWGLVSAPDTLFISIDI